MKQLWWIVGIVASGSLAAKVSAQSLVAVESAQAVAQNGSPKTQRTPLDQVVSVQFRNVTLVHALTTIAMQAGVRISYPNTLVEKVVRPVTYSATNVDARTAFVEVLRGTALSVMHAGGQFVVVEGKTASVRQGTIVGKVVSARTRQPVAGVTVTVGNAALEVKTGEDGTFRISVGAGTHTVRVRAVGMMRQARETTVAEGETVTVEIVLEPGTSVLDEVVVTGSVVATERKAITTPITVISAQDIERRGITRIEELFRGEVPGLLVLEEGTRAYANTEGARVTSKLYARGTASLLGGANPIKTYIDGVELLDPAYLGTLDPRTIERVEIVTGPQAATIYGSGALGGVMQIFTKTGRGMRAPEAMLSLKYGTLENSFSNGYTPTHQDALTVSGGMGAFFSYSANLSYGYTGQWQPALFERRIGASVGVTHTYGPFTASGSVGTLRSSNGTYRSDNAYSSTYGISSAFSEGQWVQEGAIATQFFSQQISRTSSQTIALNVDYRAFPIWQHHLTLGKNHNAFTIDPLRPNFGRRVVGEDTLYQVRNTTGGRTTLGYNMTLVPAMAGPLSANLTLGANGSQGEQLRVSGCTASMSATTILTCWTGVGGGMDVRQTLRDESWGMFSALRLGLFRQLYANVGLRIEQNPVYGQRVKVDVTPANGLAYSLEFGELTLKMLGSYGRSTRAPDASRRDEVRQTVVTLIPAHFVTTAANPDLRPEYSRGPQGGIEVYYGNLGSVTLNHYSQQVTDLIMRIPIDSLPAKRVSDGEEVWVEQNQYQNIAKIRQVGWEGTALVNIGPLSFKGAMSWNDSRILAANPSATLLGVRFQPGQRFSDLPTHTSNITASYARGGTSILIATNRVGARSGRHEVFRLQQQYARTAMYNAIRSLGTYSYVDKRYSGYTKTDLAVSHRISARISATMNVINATNSYAGEINAMEPALGRQTLFGVMLRLP